LLPLLTQESGTYEAMHGYFHRIIQNHVTSAKTTKPLNEWWQ